MRPMRTARQCDQYYIPVAAGETIVYSPNVDDESYVLQHPSWCTLLLMDRATVRRCTHGAIVAATGRRKRGSNRLRRVCTALLLLLLLDWLTKCGASGTARELLNNASNGELMAAQSVLHCGQQRRVYDDNCVTVHVPHYAAIDAPVDDSCTWRGSG